MELACLSINNSLRFHRTIYFSFGNNSVCVVYVYVTNDTLLEELLFSFLIFSFSVFFFSAKLSLQRGQQKALLCHVVSSRTGNIASAEV